MKRISLGGKHGINKFAIVDDEDFERVNQYNWFCDKNGYARGLVRVFGYSCEVLMHRFIMNAPEGTITDHIDRHRLNNQKHNLRFCTQVQNTSNRVKFTKNTISRFKGVGISKSGNNSYWIAVIMVEGKRIIRNCKSEIEAAKKYNELALTHHKEYAVLNDI